MHFISYILVQFGVHLVFLVLSLPLFVCIYLLAIAMGGYEASRSARFFLAVPFLALLFGTHWLSHRTANHIMFENMTLGPAIKMSFSELRLRLCFLPVIGRLFVPRGRDKPDDDDD